MSSRITVSLFLLQFLLWFYSPLNHQANPSHLQQIQVIATLCPKKTVVHMSRMYLEKKKHFTVDGSEIRQAPVEGTVVYLPLFKQGFIYTSQGGCLGFLPTNVVPKTKFPLQATKQGWEVITAWFTAPKPWFLRRKPRIGRTFCQGTVQQYLWVGTTSWGGTKTNDSVWFFVDSSWIIGVILCWIGEPFMYWTVKQNFV